MSIKCKNNSRGITDCTALHLKKKHDIAFNKELIIKKKNDELYLKYK